MPLPKRKKGEKKVDFISRCMGDSTMKKEYPNNDQRLAVCSDIAKNKKIVVKKKKECSEYNVLFSPGIHEIFTNRLYGGEYRYEIWNGNEMLVVPVTIIVEGVHNGFFYPAENLKESVEDWEDVLVPIYHPEDKDGNFLSAQEVESECVGRFWNSKWDEEKKGIVGEFWLFKDKLTDEVIEELINGDMEVSTGLYASHDFGNSGVWNGEQYMAVLSNYEPDHVALLPGVLGACSWEDGCGVRANKKEDRKEDKNLNKEEVNKDNMFDKLKNAVLKVLSFKDASEEDKKVYKEKYENELTDIVANELSYEDLRFSIHKMLIESFKTPSEQYPDVWIRDTYNGYFVFQKEEKLYSQNYTIDSDDNVTLGSDITEVKLKSEYVPISNEEETVDKNTVTEEEAQTKQTQSNEEDNMKIEEMVLALISNENTPFEEEDKDFLLQKGEEKLKGLMDSYTEDRVINDKVDNKDDTEEIVDNEDKVQDKNLSVDDYLANSEMPEEIRATLSNSVELYKKQKETMITKIMANEKNIFTKEQLNAKEVKELSGIVALMGTEKKDDKDEEIDFDNFDFSGNLSGFINKKEDGVIPNEKQDDGSGVPEVPVPQWNEDGTIKRV